MGRVSALCARDIAYYDYGSSLEMTELKSAFTRAGFGKKSKLAILGFEAGLMNMLEIAHHLCNVTLDMSSVPGNRARRWLAI
jgi:hypothetical protein